jgi:hypothetical protein
MKTVQVSLIYLVLTGFLLVANFECTDDDLSGGCNSNRKIISERGELLVNGITMWQFNVANENGAVPDAEKNCHAKMQLEFWFKDKTLAKTTEKPPISIVFFGGGGFFDPGSVAVYSKKMYDSTYLWTAYCDQAAKNASTNPIDYGISVAWDFNQLLNLHDVVLEGMIDYREFKGDIK